MPFVLWAMVVYNRLEQPYAKCSPGINPVLRFFWVVGSFLPVITWLWSIIMTAYTHSLLSAALGWTLALNELITLITGFIIPSIRVDQPSCALDEIDRPCHEASIAVAVSVFYAVYMYTQHGVTLRTILARAILVVYVTLSLLAPVQLGVFSVVQVVVGAAIGLFAALTSTYLFYKKILPPVLSDPSDRTHRHASGPVVFVVYLVRSIGFSVLDFASLRPPEKLKSVSSNGRTWVEPVLTSEHE